MHACRCLCLYVHLNLGATKSLICRSGQALPENVLQACCQVEKLHPRAGVVFPGVWRNGAHLSCSCSVCCGCSEACLRLSPGPACLSLGGLVLCSGAGLTAGQKLFQVELPGSRDFPSSNSIGKPKSWALKGSSRHPEPPGWTLPWNLAAFQHSTLPQTQETTRGCRGTRH